MIPFLPFLLKFRWVKFVWDNRWLVAIVVLVLLIAGEALYMRHVLSENGKLEKQVEELESTLKTERENHRKVIEALEGKARDAQERQNFKDNSRREIEKDRKNGDAPSAPVLRNTLERLRARQAQFEGATR